MDSRVIVAAGAVVVRSGPEVLLVHRPKYDDWSFPKGKLEAGEHAVTAAVREVAEETGLAIRLGPPLPDQRYVVVGGGTERPKRVHYWVGRPIGDGDVTTYLPNDEVDRLAWLPVDEARLRLSYERDRETLVQLTGVRRRTTQLVVLRHAKARPRTSWTEDDRERPLAEAGERQGQRLVPLLGAYGVQRIVSSSSRRCWTTTAPYAEAVDVPLETTPTLSEEDVTATGVGEVVQDLLGDRRPAVLCTHSPVLPLVCAALGVDDPGLGAGCMLVVHHRHGDAVAAELHTT